MPSTLQTPMRLTGTSRAATTAPAAVATEVDGRAFAWRGWTNGEGERSATAAQFARLGEHANPIGAPLFDAPVFGGARGTTLSFSAPIPAAAPAFPASEADLTAPVGAAIERLVARGLDRLAVTVRFEQGGSLLLKLALQEGTIASQIQTDVPGLEDALRAAWGQFSQDGQARGWKLAEPTFSSAPGTPDQGAAGQDGRAPGRERFESGGDTASAPRGVAATARSSGRPRFPANEHVPTAMAGRNRGLETWA